MIGDKLIITEFHKKSAEIIFNRLTEKHPGLTKPVAVSIAGESGCGKSETAHCLAEIIKSKNKKAIILGQDDYFKLPPKSNHNKREEDINWVGTDEVKLELMDEHIKMLKERNPAQIHKPLVYYEENKIGEEILNSENPDVIIAEGTYTTLLQNTDLRAFINRTYIDTKLNRLKRARDSQSDFIENVLKIEHRIISEHKKSADIILND